MIVGSNSLQNQWVPTFYVNNVVGGQSLVYDPSRKAFVNAFANGTGPNSTSLADLSDVAINPTTLHVGQALVWNGPNDWTNQFISYTSLINKPAFAPVATAGTLLSLTDVNSTGLANGNILVWDASINKFITTASGSGSTTLAGLVDVDVSTEANNQIFYYDSAALKWKNVNLDVLSKTVQSITALKDVDTTIVPSGYLQWDSTGTAVQFVTTIPAASITDLAPVATLGTYTSLTDKPTIPTATSQLTNDSGFLTSSDAVTHITAGRNISISPSSGIGNVTINSTANIERVIFQYTAGSTGTFVGVTPVTTANVTATIVDAANCVVNYTFSGYNTPPVAIMIYGQNHSSNTFAVKTNSQMPVNNNTVLGGGLSSAPDLINDLFGSTTPLTLQTRMSDTGASASFGQRAYLMILFKF